MIDHPTDPAYRRCVGLLIFNDRGLVFTGRRIDTPGSAWQMPQGGIDEGETATEAALRELYEETGTDKAVIVAECARWLNYDLPSDLRDRLWDGRYRGQTQKWFALRFTGRDEDIDVSACDPAEFDAWRWATFDELTTGIVAFKRTIYETVATSFRDLVARETGGR